MSDFLKKFLTSNFISILALLLGSWSIYQTIQLQNAQNQFSGPVSTQEIVSGPTSFTYTPPSDYIKLLEGPEGDKGLRGYKGDTGDKGDKGDTGDKGDKGDEGDTGPAGPSGPAGTLLLTYGSFYDTTTQTLPTGTSPRAITYNSTSESDGISITNDSRVTFSKAGVYNVQFSLLALKSDAGVDELDVWLVKDGSPVADSNTRLTLLNANDHKVAAWNFVLTMEAGHYIELYWYSADKAITLSTLGPFTSPTRPRIPSVILTATQIK